jgi:hypothetical protein
MKNICTITPVIFIISLQNGLSHGRVLCLSGANIQMTNMKGDTNNCSKENVPLDFISTVEVAPCSVGSVSFLLLLNVSSNSNIWVGSVTSLRC